MNTNHAYQSSHPWLRFEFDMSKLPYRVWLLLGEAQSKCEHIAGVPLSSDTAEQLYQVYLAKGAHATTAIEGNTLTEEQVLQQIQGRLEVPRSKEYLRQEVVNILNAFHEVRERCLAGETSLTLPLICEDNRRILRGLELKDDAVPGMIRSHSVVVGPYRGAPAQDCEFLLTKLCGWLGEVSFQRGDGNPDNRIGFALLQAIVAHIYIAWIHPFGDGNGRTARLVEVQLLLAAGVPDAACHLLSNFYNETRNKYYSELDYASKSGGDINRFIEYALQGFVDGLREQLKTIREQQLRLAWRDFIFRYFKGKLDKVSERRRELALEILTDGKPLFPGEIRDRSRRLIEAYYKLNDRTITRDLDGLVEMGLAIKKEGGYAANRDKILQFLPMKCD